MSVYSKDANRTFRSAAEAQSYGFEYSADFDDYLQGYNFNLLLNGDNVSYHSNPETNRRDDNLLVDKRGRNKLFSIGVEIEKISEFGYKSVTALALWRKWQWRKENDGSITPPYGHEIVSPVFSLFGDNRLFDEIQMPIIRTIINGNVDRSCGGHIHIGSDSYTSKQLFEGLSSFFPLLYSLYEKRINMTFSQAKEKYQYYTQTNDHHTAIQITPNTLEFRIPPGVINVTNLMWRVDLMRIFTKNINTSESDIVSMMQNIESDLYKHLVKVIAPENISIKIQKFIKYTQEYNWKKIIIPSITEQRQREETTESNV